MPRHVFHYVYSAFPPLNIVRSATRHYFRFNLELVVCIRPARLVIQAQSLPPSDRPRLTCLPVSRSQIRAPLKPPSCFIPGLSDCVVLNLDPSRALDDEFPENLLRPPSDIAPIFDILCQLSSDVLTHLKSLLFDLLAVLLPARSQSVLRFGCFFCNLRAGRILRCDLIMVVCESFYSRLVSLIASPPLILGT